MSDPRTEVCFHPFKHPCLIFHERPGHRVEVQTPEVRRTRFIGNRFAHRSPFVAFHKYLDFNSSHAWSASLLNWDRKREYTKSCHTKFLKTIFFFCTTSLFAQQHFGAELKIQGYVHQRPLPCSALRYTTRTQPYLEIIESRTISLAISCLVWTLECKLASMITTNNVYVQDLMCADPFYSREDEQLASSSPPPSPPGSTTGTRSTRVALF